MNEVDRVVDGALCRLDELRSTSDALASVRAEYTSPDGLVTVTVDDSGALVELEIAQDLSAVSADTLAESVVVTASTAARHALDRRGAILETLRVSFTDT